MEYPRLGFIRVDPFDRALVELREVISDLSRTFLCKATCRGVSRSEVLESHQCYIAESFFNYEKRAMRLLWK